MFSCRIAPTPIHSTLLLEGTIHPYQLPNMHLLPELIVMPYQTKPTPHPITHAKWIRPGFPEKPEFSYYNCSFAIWRLCGLQFPKGCQLLNIDPAGAGHPHIHDSSRNCPFFDYIVPPPPKTPKPEFS